MRFPISFFLACATISLAIPSRYTAHETRIVASYVSNVIRARLGLALANRQSDASEEDDNGSAASSSGDGLTGDDCTSDADCMLPRRCVSSPDGLCIPERPVFCSSNADCVDGESCFTLESARVCVSDKLIGERQPVPSEPTIAPVPGSGTGLTLEDCSSDADCKSPRTCTSRGICVPETFQSCTSSTDCVDGETCFHSDSAGLGLVCISEAVIPPPDEGTGLTGDPCQESTSCAGSRVCSNLETLQTCNGEGDCRCRPRRLPKQCEDDSECVTGEGCFDARDSFELIGTDTSEVPDEVLQGKFCVSVMAIDDAVCIGSHSLGHISREELVFEKDVVAHVLCDVDGSCATAGHMVVYKGRGMMMKSYCELTSCVRKVMKVNSPKYRPRLTVQSLSKDLVFTALAARFQTRAEEGVLSAVVRFGF